MLDGEYNKFNYDRLVSLLDDNEEIALFIMIKLQGESINFPKRNWKRIVTQFFIKNEVPKSITLKALGVSHDTYMRAELDHLKQGRNK
ncbi:MAG: hypothetical protein JHC33_04950 [Ignisphaera sp.]|nr:hypothetical protein [Ignisphaera sp.]